MSQSRKSRKSQKSQEGQESQKQQSSRPTITAFVLAQLSKNPTIGTAELIQFVCSAFPWSKFSKTHVAWYKHQIRAGKYVLENNITLPPAKKAKKEK